MPETTPAVDILPPETAQPPAPKIEDFDDDVTWANALTDWTRGAVAAEHAQIKTREAIGAFHDREVAARDRYDDYDEVVYDLELVIPDAAARIVMASKNGPDLGYYLATHQDEARAMVGMSDVQVAREIGRIETRLASEPLARPAPKPKAKPRPSATQVPDPIVPISGGAVPNRDPGRMGMAEYRAARLAGKIR